MVEQSAGRHLRKEIEEFSRCIDVGEDTPQEAQECLDAFLGREGWSSHDASIDFLWEDFVRCIDDLANDLDSRTLSKPSGPLRAALSCTWAYPTFTTKKKQYGHTMDKTNPCIRGQYMKLGADRRVRTQDRYPIRESHAEKGVRWSAIYDNWEAMDKACSTLNQQLNKHSKFLIFLGLDNFKNFRGLLGLDGEKQVELHTLTSGVPFYSQPFKFAVVKHKATKKVLQVVWFSYHLQHFFYNYRESPSRYFHDFLWNGICELAHVPIKDAFCFSRSSSSAGSAALSKTRKHGVLATALLMRMFEKGTGSNYSEKEIRHIFRGWIDKDPKLAAAKTLSRDGTGSFLGPLLRLKASQGGKTAGPMNIQALLQSNKERYKSDDWKTSDERRGRSERMASTMQLYRDQVSSEERKQHSERVSKSVRFHRAQWDSDAAVHASQQFNAAGVQYRTERRARLDEQRPNDSDIRLATGARKGLEASWQMKRDKTWKKAAAFLRVLQTRTLLQTEPALLSATDRRIRNALNELREWIRVHSRLETMPLRLQKFFKKRARFYGEHDDRGGLRYEGDGGLLEDDFPYDTENHPSVRL